MFFFAIILITNLSAQKKLEIEIKSRVIDSQILYSNRDVVKFKVQPGSKFKDIQILTSSIFDSINFLSDTFHYANFSNDRFYRSPKISHILAEAHFNIANSNFDSTIDFSNSNFESVGNFFDSRFNKVSFDSSIFSLAYFQRAKFNNSVIFFRTTFKKYVDFAYAAFNKYLILSDIRTSDSTKFSFWHCQLPDTIDLSFNSDLRSIIDLEA